MSKSQSFFKVSKFIWAILLACSLSLFSACSSTATTSSSSVSDSLSESGVAAEKVEGIPAVKHVDAADKSDSTSSSNAATSLSDTAAPSQTTTGNPDASQGVVAPHNASLLVRFLDVGQGDAALITCEGKNLLIDGGPASASQKLYSVLKDLGINKLDYIVATHPDADHAGGIAGALQYASCSTFYCSVTQHDTRTFNNVISRLGATPITVPHVGDSFMLGNARVQFVNPVTTTRDTNNSSLVCRLDYYDTSFLFTGDAERESEYAMMSSGANLDVDVLKVAHHGSDSSSSQSFLSAITPRFAIISVGKNNYGHPTAEVLNRLKTTGAEVLRTDTLGTIYIDSDGKNISTSYSKGKVER